MNWRWRLIYFFLSVVVSNGAIASNVAAATTPNHLFFGCEIYDIADKKNPKILRKFPGEFCLFQNDGSVVLTELDAVVKFDKSMKRLWSFSTKAHHQLNASVDGKSILVIGAEGIPVQPLDPKKRIEIARSDVLYVLDQMGKVQKKFSLYDERAQFLKEFWDRAFNRRFPIWWTPKRFEDMSWEIAHTNSFYEIDKNEAEVRKPEFKKGNYIVNDISLGLAFVIDSKLNKVLWQRPLSPLPVNMIHDVQVLPSGRILFYDNGTTLAPQSRLAEMDVLASEKIVWTYQGPPGQKFFSPRLGGVQKLASTGGYLYTDITSGPKIAEIDKNNRELWFWSPGKNKYLQQARIQDLTEFLKNNQGM